MKKVVGLLVITLLCSAISACGWRLRGSGESVDIQSTIYLEVSTGQVYQALKKSLSQKQQLANIATGDIQLILGEEFYERRSASVNNQVQTIQYQLTFSVPYEILDNQGQPLTEKSIAELSRYYTYNQNAINSSAKEEKALKKEMIRQLSQRILRRVQFINQKMTKAQ
ncbi:MAG: LPS-assembly lipoprotein [Candidatus Endobugula sp.]|jgi:LPS-assembly lipoprotein